MYMSMSNFATFIAAVGENQGNNWFFDQLPKIVSGFGVTQNEHPTVKVDKYCILLPG